MPVTVDTSTSTTAVAYGSQRKVAVCANGVRWLVHYNGTALETWYSNNDGATWNQETGTFTGTNADLFIDKDDYAHLVVDNGSSIVYYRGTPTSAARTDWTWTGGTTVSAATGNGYPTVVAHREGTAWKAHFVWSRNFSSSYGHWEYRCRCTSTSCHWEDATCCPADTTNCSTGSHGHTTYTAWSTSQWDCRCGYDCHTWQNGWHSHSGCTCSHIHACSSATQESRWIDEGTTTDNYVYYARYNISAAQAITVDQSPTVIAGSYGNNTPTYPTLDFYHNGDAKSASGDPHLACSWSATETGTGDGVRFRKATYSGGTWSWGTDRDIITTEYIYSTFISGIWDGTRWICAYVPSGATSTIKVFERNASDTATTWRTPTALSDGVITGLSITCEGGDIYLYASGTTSDDVKLLAYERATDTWDATWTSIEATDAVAGNLSTKRTTGAGSSPSGHEVLYLTGTGSPYNIRHEFTGTNAPPTSPLWVSPTSGDAADTAEILTLDWDFNDPNPSDTQSAYTVRKREGTGSYEYWNGSTWDSSESASTKISSSATQLALAASWGADGDDDHYYAVKTWDAADTGPSPWSTELRVVPSAQDNPTITTITTVTTTFYDVVWTIGGGGTQTKYRVRVYGDDSGIDYDDLVYDSGEIVSATQLHSTPFPTDGVTRWVSLYTWNDEGLLSDEDTEDVTVSYSGPVTPTLVISTYQGLDEHLQAVDAGLEVAITNPAPTTEPDTSYNDLYRRELSGAYLSLPGETNDWAGIANNSRLWLDGDFQIEFSATSDWLNSTAKMIFDQQFSGHGISLLKHQTNYLQLSIGNGGSSISHNSNTFASVGIASGDRVWFKLEYDGTGPTTTFYYKMSAEATWSSLGSATSGTPPWYSTEPTIQTYIGRDDSHGQLIDMDLYSMKWFDGISGIPVLDLDFTRQKPGVTSFTDRFDNTVTIYQSGSPQAEILPGSSTVNEGRIATELATNTTYIDLNVASDVEHEYLVRAHATSNGTSTDSAWTS